jgi:hypothetical protein
VTLVLDLAAPDLELDLDLLFAAEPTPTLEVSLLVPITE